MTLVDDRGRLFGKLNVVDALIAFLVFGLVPLLFAAYLLFRPMPAGLTSIEPAQIQAGSSVDLTIRGNHLRPFMRVSFDAHQAGGFLFADPSRAVVPVSAMPPGVYDVILYDHAQERARLPKALEVLANPRAAQDVNVSVFANDVEIVQTAEIGIMRQMLADY